MHLLYFHMLSINLFSLMFWAPEPICCMVPLGKQRSLEKAVEGRKQPVHFPTDVALRHQAFFMLFKSRLQMSVIFSFLIQVILSKTVSRGYLKSGLELFLELELWKWRNELCNHYNLFIIVGNCNNLWSVCTPPLFFNPILLIRITIMMSYGLKMQI